MKLDKMSANKIEALMAKAQAELARREEEERARAANESKAKDIVAKAEQDLKALGYSLSDFVAGGTARKASGPRKGGTVAPKYKNPSTGETWTGRGRKPKWVEAHLASGGSMAQITI